MNKPFQEIIVLGGGTAGWLSACILASQLSKRDNENYHVTVIESPDIPTVGVGEGTVPTMRQTLKMIGVSETDFIRECDVTFKQSIKFVDWLYNPNQGQPDSYHHLFNYPYIQGRDLTAHWLANTRQVPYAQALSEQALLCDLGLSPKKITHKEFQGAAEYAYHLDAGKFGAFLAKHGENNLNIRRVSATIEEVELDEHGNISVLISNTGKRFSGDLFIDCSGFSARLIDKALQVDFVSKSHQLLVDTAIAMQVPYSNPDIEIPPYTIATAKEAGWIWDIGLTERKGVGYVYSSTHTSHQQAEQTLREYIGEGSDELVARRIPMAIGHREHFWHKNCVAIGLSAGFVEPLEATALLIVEASAKLLAEKIPNHQQGLSYAQTTYNRITRYAWERVIDFIKLHYFLSQRTDTAFWRDNVDPKTAPESLLEKLAYWQHNVPTASDFFSQYEVFQLENYLYVLYGMNYNTEIATECLPFQQQALQDFTLIQQRAAVLAEQLPKHRQLIEKIKHYGLSKI